ncbi:uracil-DNA glycosylase family protein [Pannus brasiliensis CCIBt3594]|uniref:Uracil-DNA glycosylase family protein n=1 Tax=Pannus brasiliensis CCIBt3594 TaxID=1427578 RepID=A0AAW9QV17_9CHRO
MSDIATLIDRVRREAERESFPIDTPIYESAKKDPRQPVLYAGNLESQLCFFGRDLGRDEVREGQPLIGAAGTLVREGFFLAWQGRKPKNKAELLAVLDRIFLTNTVPYKPPGNKAYSEEVKARFRPFIEQLLVLHWQGDHIITLGTEACKWFTPYGKPGEVDRFFLQGDRFYNKLRITLTATDDAGVSHQKPAVLMPLPHPSPLNQRYYALFPDMLQKRLNDFAF